MPYGRNVTLSVTFGCTFSPRSIHHPANLRQWVPSCCFYRPREGKDSTWVDDSTTPEDEYQRRYYVVEVPEVVDVGEERKLKKARRADRKSPHQSSWTGWWSMTCIRMVTMMRRTATLPSTCQKPVL
jgi:hypothetical protein